MTDTPQTEWQPEAWTRQPPPALSYRPVDSSPATLNERAVVLFPGVGWLADYIVTTHPYRDNRAQVVDVTTEEAWWLNQHLGHPRATLTIPVSRVYVEHRDPDTQPDSDPDVRWLSRALPETWTAPGVRYPTHSHDAGSLIGHRIIAHTSKGWVFHCRAISEPISDHEGFWVNALTTSNYYRARNTGEIRNQQQFNAEFLWVQ